MKKVLCAAAAAAFLLSGCVSSQYWVKNGATVAQHERTLTNCQVSGAQQVPTNTQVGWAPYVGIYSSDANANLRGKLVAQCMGDKGYQLVTIPTCTPEVMKAYENTPLSSNRQVNVSEKTCMLYRNSQYYMVTPA